MSAVSVGITKGKRNYIFKMLLGQRSIGSVFNENPEILRQVGLAIVREAEWLLERNKKETPGTAPESPIVFSERYDSVYRRGDVTG